MNIFSEHEIPVKPDFFRSLTLFVEMSSQQKRSLLEIMPIVLIKVWKIN